MTKHTVSYHGKASISLNQEESAQILSESFTAIKKTYEVLVGFFFFTLPPHIMTFDCCHAL